MNPDPVQAFDSAQLPQQFGEPSSAVPVNAVPRSVLGDDNELFHALIRQELFAGGAAADAVATACVVLGIERGIELLDSLGLDGFFVRTNGEILATQGLTSRVQII